MNDLNNNYNSLFEFKWLFWVIIYEDKVLTKKHCKILQLSSL